MEDPWMNDCLVVYIKEM